MITNKINPRAVCTYHCFVKDLQRIGEKKYIEGLRVNWTMLEELHQPLPDWDDSSAGIISTFLGTLSCCAVPIPATDRERKKKNGTTNTTGKYVRCIPSNLISWAPNPQGRSRWVPEEVVLELLEHHCQWSLPPRHAAEGHTPRSMLGTNRWKPLQLQLQNFLQFERLVELLVEDAVGAKNLHFDHQQPLRRRDLSKRNLLWQFMKLQQVPSNSRVNYASSNWVTSRDAVGAVGASCIDPIIALHPHDFHLEADGRCQESV